MSRRSERSRRSSISVQDEVTDIISNSLPEKLVDYIHIYKYILKMGNSYWISGNAGQ